MRSTGFLSRSIVCLCLAAGSASAQESSSWGIDSSFAPWQTTKSVEKLTNVVFDQDRQTVSQGSDLSIGIVRGRVLSGDWGVSFVRKRIDADRDAVTIAASGCTGSQSSPSAPLVYQCSQQTFTSSADRLELTGVELHKFAPMITVKSRVQLGVNLAVGIAVGRGTVRTQKANATFTCTFTGTAAAPGGADPCAGGTRSGDVITAADPTLHPFSYIVKYDRNLVPLAKLEMAGSLIAAPRLKVRVSGGLNYPAVTTLGVTAVVFLK